MMDEENKEYLEDIRRHAGEVLGFFSEPMKPERERSVCRAFLRCIGVPFSEEEITAPAEEPTDVVFRSARFQIRELLDPGRKRGDEWKRKMKACSLDDLKELYTPSKPISLSTITPFIIEALSEKATKYGATGCAKLDILVYANLSKLHLHVEPEFPSVSDLLKQGWRSASMLFPPYGVVFFATSDAHAFLQACKASALNKHERIDTIFD